MVTEFIGKLGENTKLEDIIVSNKNAYVYNHPGNKVASIIYYTGDEDTAKELALQVAAMNPEYLSFESVPQSYRDELLEKFKAEMLDSDKPANIIEQIIAGKLQKYLSDLVLLEQEYIRDNSKKIKDIMPS
jgi:elongation factor Ts